jgi:hypothetical protein
MVNIEEINICWVASRAGQAMPYRRESAAALRSRRRFLILVSNAVAAYYALAVHLKGEGAFSGLAANIG